MTDKKKFKEKVRERQHRTGESYTTARRNLEAEARTAGPGVPEASAPSTMPGPGTAPVAADPTARHRVEPKESDPFASLRRPSEKAHPLEPVVRAAFEASPCQDIASLAPRLAGATWVGERGTAAYRTVAEDVLGYMESQGKLYRDSQGWWRLAHDRSVGADMH